MPIDRPAAPSGGHGAADWQDALRASHSDWLGDPGPSISVGEGWSALVAALFDGIADVARSADPPATVWITDVKEKYGSARVSWHGTLDAEQDARVEALVEAAEKASETVCDVCGRRGAMRASREGAFGWIAVRCPDHSDGFPHRAR